MSHQTVATLPRVAGDVSGTIAARAGRQLAVECLAYGGTPAPALLWHVAGRLQSAQAAVTDTFTEHGVEVTRSTLQLQVVTTNFPNTLHHSIQPTNRATSAQLLTRFGVVQVRREDDGAAVSCEAASPARELPVWVKAVLNVGCRSLSTVVLHVSPSSSAAGRAGRGGRVCGSPVRHICLSHPATDACPAPNTDYEM